MNGDENTAQTAHGRQEMADFLRGRKVEAAEYEQHEGLIFGLLLHLDDGSVMHIEPWGKGGLELWRTSPEEVAEAKAEAEAWDAGGYSPQE